MINRRLGQISLLTGIAGGILINLSPDIAKHAFSIWIVNAVAMLILNTRIKCVEVVLLYMFFMSNAVIGALKSYWIDLNNIETLFYVLGLSLIIFIIYIPFLKQNRNYFL